MKGAQADSLYSSASLFTKLFPPAQCRQKTKVLCAHREPDVLTLTVLTRREGQCQLRRQAVPAPLEDKMFSQDHPHSQSQGQALIQGSWTPRSYPFLSKERTWEVYSPPGWRVPREAGAQTNDVSGQLPSGLWGQGVPACFLAPLFPLWNHSSLQDRPWQPIVYPHCLSFESPSHSRL